ncbi:pyruvate kinase [Cytobacillus sp. Hz8]|uniref:pyruvate kinase n=1 Tax=Cytobacillus sp. Hz8 TaxID=3347168 RepID=UPI0035D8A247
MTDKLGNQLHEIGFSNLNAANAHILFTLRQILTYLGVNILDPKLLSIPSPLEAKIQLCKNAETLFRSKDDCLRPTIMVTLDEQMLEKRQIIDALLLQGMDIARINCAHGNEKIWKKMIEIVRHSEQVLMKKELYIGRKCKIYMDLAGPKIRIGKMGNDSTFPNSHKSNFFTLIKDDLLRLYLSEDHLGHPATEDAPAGVPVTLAKAFTNVRIHDRIFIDDGKIYGRVENITQDYIEVKILTPFSKAAKVKEGKGINLPDSLLSLNLPALTEKDISDLAFVTKHADLLGISFVHSPLDLIQLKSELKRHSCPHIAVVAKIETKDAVHQLGRILLEGLTFEAFGIMIARGDLAVEVGFENLAFVQDEIISICQAAHVPTIWATGVLENLTKKGFPARSELTDVSQGKRANCLMLNKGTYIVESLILLKKLLET